MAGTWTHHQRRAMATHQAAGQGAVLPTVHRAADLVRCERSADSPIEPPASAGQVTAEPDLALAEQAVTDRLPIGGIDDPQQMKDALLRLQQAAARRDTHAIAAMVRYPLVLYDSGTPLRQYAEAAEVTADFKLIFTPQVCDAIQSARYDTLFVNWQGVMIGRGEVWLGSDDGSQSSIIAVNGHVLAGEDG